MHVSKNKNQGIKSKIKQNKTSTYYKRIFKKLFLTVIWCKIEDLQRRHQDDKISALSKLLN